MKMRSGYEQQSKSHRKRKKSKKTKSRNNRKKQKTTIIYSDEIQIAEGEIIYDWKSKAYVVDECLGQGRYGKVYKVTAEVNPRAKPLACKVQLYTRPKYLKKYFKNEAKIHRLLSHKNIVKFLSAYCSIRYSFIFMEYYPNGTLYNLVHERGGLTVSEARFFFYQIICGLKYMHKMNIIHRDLKLDNIFLAKKMRIKIGDFGQAKNIGNRNKKIKKRKTAKLKLIKNHYQAPEVIKEGNYSAASDIWTVGVILYKMVFNRSPFEIDEKFLTASEYPFEFEVGIADDFYDILQDIFQPKHLRPDAKQCLYSSFLFETNIPKQLPETIRTVSIHDLTDSDPSYEP